ncbi:MAG: Na+/H+ antiporter NhaA [Myxococcales bacterium]|nr:Na+/H+ antiporter NhaA [Myxococcales bacterium]
MIEVKKHERAARPGPRGKEPPEPAADEALRVWEDEGGSLVNKPSTQHDNGSSAPQPISVEADLPSERADRFTKPLGRFLKVEAAAGAALLVATCAALLLTVVFGTARAGIRSIPIYFLLGGVVWLAFDASGIHATIAGVALGLMTPARGWVNDDRLRAIFGRVLAYPQGEHWSGDTADRAHLRQAGRAAREVISPLEQLEMTLHPWVGFATRRQALSWPFLCAGAVLTGIGFTMSLFIAGLAYSPAMLDAAKIGLLGGSVVSAAAGLSWLGWLSRKKQSA